MGGQGKEAGTALLGGIDGTVNKCQQRGKQHSRNARSLFCAFAHVGARFCAGKIYIWVQGI